MRSAARGSSHARSSWSLVYWRLEPSWRDLPPRLRALAGGPSDSRGPLSGSRIYHNFVGPHEAPKGETPAERKGIKVEGQDEWLTLIQNASIAKPSTEITQEQTKLG